MPSSRIYLTRPGGHRRPFYRIRVNGKLHYLGTDIDDAERRAARLIAKLPIAVEPRTVAGLIDVWKTRHPDYQTPEYLKAWQEAFGPLKLRDLREDHLDEYLAGLKRRFRRWSVPKVKPAGWASPPRVKLSASTIRKYLGIAHVVCDWGRKRRFLNVIVDRPHGVPTQRRTRHDYDPAVVARAFATLPQRAWNILTFIYATGCRPKEARLLLWSQVNLGRKLCIIEHHKTATATGRDKVLRLPPLSLKILKKLDKQSKSGTGYVFLNRNAKPYTQEGLRALMYRRGLAQRYLRNTAATGWLNDGADVMAVREQLGHRYIESTMHYVRLLEQTAKKSVEGLRVRLPDSPRPSTRRRRRESEDEAASAGRRAGRTRRSPKRESANGTEG